MHAGKSANTLFKRHVGPNTLHEECSQNLINFLNFYEGKSLAIDTLINRENVKAIDKAKQILPSIIDTVLVCGHMGIAMRGHRDDRKNHPPAGEYSERAGVGNFVELINFGIRRGDKILEDHYKNAPGNAHYFSPSSQNEFINISGALILEKVILQIKPDNTSNYFFSILADEAMDCSQKEQMSLVFRFIDTNHTIHKEFTGFVHLKYGLSGKAIAQSITERVSELGLDIKKCRGQGYDGAGNVAGYKNGAAAHILRESRKSIFIHCFSHRLSLAVSKHFKIISVSNMLETATKISYFFHNSEQRQRCLEKHIKAFRLQKHVSDNLDGD